MALERRYGPGMAQDSSDEPGLLMENDGSVWVVDTAGVRTMLPGSGSGGGAAWFNGSGVPSSGLGANGDYYLDDDNGDVYTKASGAWVLAANIEGPQGIQGDPGDPGTPGTPGTPGADGAPGSVWRNGSGVPSNGLGINGDYYLDEDTGDVYLKAAGAYSLVANIKGPTGPTDYDGGNASSVYGGAIIIDGGNA